MDKHPQLSVSGEYHWEFLDRGLAQISETQHALLNSFGQFDAFRADYESLIRKHILRIETFRKSEQKDFDKVLWLGDRTPEPAVPLTLRDARYILIQRDGRDALVSAAFHMLNLHQRMPCLTEPQMLSLHKKFVEDPQYFSKYPRELLSCEVFVRSFAWNWAQVVTQNYDFHLKSLASEVVQKTHLIHYESLLKDFENSKSALFHFLGLDPADCLPMDDKTSPGFDVETPTAFERRGTSGEWPKYFTDETARWFGEEAYKALVYVGYTW